ncbi:MAG: hypothetical protein ACRENO_05775 [Thermodesulfobacteriota bacterium]
MRKLIYIAPVILVIFAVLFFGKKDDPKHFEELISGMIRTANEKNLADFMDFFSINYKDSSGANYTLINNVVKSYFERFDSFEAAYEDFSVSILKDDEGRKTADVELEIIVSGVKNGTISNELIGTSGHLKYLKLKFIKTGFNRWKIIMIDGIEDAEY